MFTESPLVRECVNFSIFLKTEFTNWIFRKSCAGVIFATFPKVQFFKEITKFSTVFYHLRQLPQGFLFRFLSQTNTQKLIIFGFMSFKIPISSSKSPKRNLPIFKIKKKCLSHRLFWNSCSGTKNILCFSNQRLQICTPIFFLLIFRQLSKRSIFQRNYEIFGVF